MKHKRESREKLWKELLVKSQDGNNSAYHSLLKEMNLVMIKIVRSKITNEQLADDTVQNILLGVHKALPTYDSKQPACAWIYAIARYKITDSLRSIYKKQEREEMLPEFDVQDYLSIETDFENEVMQKEALAHYMSSLQEDQLTALRLTKLNGLSVSDASKKLGISPSNVKVLVHRGIKNIQKLIEREAMHEHK